MVQVTLLNVKFVVASVVEPSVKLPLLFMVTVPPTVTVPEPRKVKMEPLVPIVIPLVIPME